MFVESTLLKLVDALSTVVDLIARDAGARLSYRELDPDVFGEELEKPVYAGAERIAAVGAVLTSLGRAARF